MTTKSELLKRAEELEIDGVDETWRKADIERAIENREDLLLLKEEMSEVDHVEPEKAAEVVPEKTEEEPVAPVVESPKIEEPKVEESKIEAPKIETPKTETIKTEEPKPVVPSNRYRLNYGITLDGRVYAGEDEVVLTPEKASVLKAVGAIGPVDEIARIKDRAKSLPAGEYAIQYGLTRDGKHYQTGSVLKFTAEEADKFEKIGLILAKE